MDEAVSQDFASIKDRFSKIEYPNYIKTSQEHCKMNDDLTMTLLKCVFEKKSSVKKICRYKRRDYSTKN